MPYEDYQSFYSEPEIFPHSRRILPNQALNQGPWENKA